MYICLEEISADALQEYVENFDIEYNVSIWWPNGVKGRGVPFDSQAEQVADYELWLAELRDVIDATRGVTKELSHQQDLAIEKFNAAFKELERMGVELDYDPDQGFSFRPAA